MSLPVAVMLVTFACMAAAVAWDRRPSAPRPADAPGADRRADRGVATPAAATVQAQVPARGWPPAGSAFHLLGAAAGWALLGPDGRLLGSNLSPRQALLAGVCALLRLHADSRMAGAHCTAAPTPPWRTVRAEGPGAVLLGQASPRGAVLAVLARRGHDPGGPVSSGGTGAAPPPESVGATLDRWMTWCLAEVEADWEAWVAAADAADPAGQGGVLPAGSGVVAPGPEAPGTRAESARPGG